jgi:uncharacterized protein (TIGR00297 family)
MQRTQRMALHSRHAVPHAASASHPTPAPLARALPLTQRRSAQHAQRHQQPRQQQRGCYPLLPGAPRRDVACADAADGSSSDMQPKARAAAPVQPPAVSDGPTGTPTGAGSSPSSPAAGSPSNGPVAPQSYSTYYKSQNTKYYTPPGGSGSSSSGSGTTNGSSSTPRAHNPAPAAPTNGAEPAAAAAAAAPEADVSDALRKAQAALSAAETSLETVATADASAAAAAPDAPAAALLARALAVWTVVRPAVVVATLSVLMVASHAFGLALQWAAATLSALGIAAWGHRRGSLSPSGAVAAATIGLATLGCSLRLGATLLAFFFASSKLTQFKEDLKDGIEEGAKRGGQRDWKQVLCNSGVPTLLAIGYGALAGCLDLPLGALNTIEPWRADLLTLLLGGFLGYYACCCGDTWASELGVLSTATPRLITTLKPVRRGTNGGVTVLGLSASVAGGLFIGAAFYLAAVVSPTLWVFDAQRQAALAQWRLIPLGLMAGLFGSLVDSLLGATVQFTGFDVKKQKIVGRPGPDVVHISGLPFLSNNAVNLVSASVTSALTALVALRMFA